jgi:hypothetical protein
MYYPRYGHIWALPGGYSPKLSPLTTFDNMNVYSSDTRIDNDEYVP